MEKIPLVILPADENPTKIKWVVREYCGAEIYRIIDGEVAGEPVRDPLQIGDVVSLYGVTATVKQGEDGHFYAENTAMVSPLEFGEDDRKCWVSGGIISRKAMKMIAKMDIVK